MGVLRAATHHLGSQAAYESWLCLCPGDGVHPRTGALVAFLTHWTALSVDPQMRRPNGWPVRTCAFVKPNLFTNPVPQPYPGVDRLKVAHCRVEDLEETATKNLLILCTHSHAPLKACWNAVQAERKVMVVLPCCQHLEIPKGTEIVRGYSDGKILSPRREILIYEAV